MSEHRESRGEGGCLSGLARLLVNAARRRAERRAKAPRPVQGLEAYAQLVQAQALRFCGRAG